MAADRLSVDVIDVDAVASSFTRESCSDNSRDHTVLLNEATIDLAISGKLISA